MKTKKIETSSYGTDGHLNVFTGEYQQPIIRNLDKGGKNINTIGTTGDTTTFTQCITELKDKLSQLLPDLIPSSLLTEDDIVNKNLIFKYKTEEQDIPHNDIKWFPLKAIKKLLEHYEINYEGIS